MSRVFSALQEAQRRAGQGTKPAWEGYDRQGERALGVEPPAIDSGSAGTLTLCPKDEDRFVSLTDAQDVAGESFRLLASRLSYLRKTRNLRRLLITSSVTNEGKSTVAANLAVALADQGGQRTLLIDSDHRHGTISRRFRCTGKPGMCEWLAAGGPIAPFAQRVANRTLWFVPTGRGGRDPERYVQAERVSELLDTTNSFFDWVVIDSSPATVLADTTIWSGVVDGCLLVVREGVTPKRMLQKAIAAIDPAKMLGVLLNDCSDPSHAYHSLYYQAKPNGK